MKNLDLDFLWSELTDVLASLFGKKPDLQGSLFLIGMNECRFQKPSYTKEEKQDLIHVGVCKILSYSGYYEFQGYDDDGWPHYKQLRQTGKMKLDEQEDLLKAHVIYYFKDNGMYDALIPIPGFEEDEIH